jgi:hypothetical protein
MCTSNGYLLKCYLYVEESISAAYQLDSSMGSRVLLNVLMCVANSESYIV